MKKEVYYIVAIFILIVIIILFVFKKFGDNSNDNYHGFNQNNDNSLNGRQVDREFVLNNGNIDPQPQQNPIMNYYWNESEGLDPSTIGDPLRINDVAGPISQNPKPMFYPEYTIGYTSGDGNKYMRYQQSNGNPVNISADSLLNIPVKSGTLVDSNERYKKSFYIPRAQKAINDTRRKFTNTLSSILDNNNQSGFENIIRPNTSQDYLHPYVGFHQIDERHANDNLSDVPFYGSVDSFAPFKEVRTPWEKVGLLTSFEHNKHDSCDKNDSECKRRHFEGDRELLNLYRRPIAPLNDLWEYNVQDKNGFIIPLRNRTYLEDGDIVEHVIGKGGPWKTQMFLNNKYIWM
jgi:hypothetical protein